MSEAVFVQEGGAIDYTPTADIAAGEVVVLGTLVGVTKVPIPANTLGALAVRGVFDVAKDAATIFTAGQFVFWDEAANQATTTGTVLLGKAILAAGNGDATVRVLLTPGNSSGSEGVGGP